VELERNMGRIFVMGYDLPSVLNVPGEARHYRTSQFVEPLLADGHQVFLLASSGESRPVDDHGLGDDLIYLRADLRRRGWMGRVRKLQEEFRPDGVLAVTFLNSLRAARLDGARPTWMDVYGDRLAESQVWQAARRTARTHRGSISHTREVLASGDVYSTCGSPQKFAAVGQLGMIGRLNQHTFGYEFVYPILPGAPDAAAPPPPSPVLRGRHLPHDAFVVLWAGGYNVWTDVDTLFHALERVMGEEPGVHFVSVGGNVGTPEMNDTYAHFQALVRESPFRERYTLIGWVEPTAVPPYYMESDVGVNLDAFHYETLLGTRTRLTEMMRYGLPVVTTLGCELSYIVRKQGLGRTCAIGDADGLGERFLALARDRDGTRRMGERARDYAAGTLSFSHTTAAFREWARDPWHAPDRPRRTRFFLDELESTGRFIARHALWRLWGLEQGQ
jgi:glycosyltransferase involved in cell wall biosynthesis